MAQASGNPPLPVSRTTPLHPLHLSDRPVDFHFSFEERQSRVGASASIGAHLAFVLMALLAIRLAPTPDYSAFVPEDPIKDIVWIAAPGPGGGGGGGGNKSPEPPRKAELPGKQKITVPVMKEPDPTPEKPKEPPPEEQLTIPAKPMAAAEVVLPGAIQSPAVTDSAGAGDRGGAGTGTGTGIGSGQGSGLGPGFGGGTGGGAYRAGSGITSPVPLLSVKPQYTADAMRAKVQGAVYLEAIVMADGTIGEVRVTRSLDPIFGLDQEALKAARQWRFRPGMRLGEPVPVIVTLILEFTLR
ncbi:MAG: energy transducer TonB [Vicinamibacterales bacterium]